MPSYRNLIAEYKPEILHIFIEQVTYTIIYFYSEDIFLPKRQTIPDKKQKSLCQKLCFRLRGKTVKIPAMCSKSQLEKTNMTTSQAQLQN